MELQSTPAHLIRSLKTRLEILQDMLTQDCIQECSNIWYKTAIQTLERNNTCINSFCNSIRTLLDKGRGKFRNILITGPTNCGKSFILKAITKAFNTFDNPATSSFAWVGAEQAEVIFLNDFRWSSQVIPWHDLLLLLEGENVHLPAPKIHFVQDILLSADTPIFATSSDEIKLIKNGIIVERETEMMAVRWKVFKFSKTISETDQIEINPCPHCFSKLVFSY